MSFETYEDVTEALDKWLSERRGMRTQVTGRTSMGRYFCRLESRGESDVSAHSDFSTNDATAMALEKLQAEERAAE